MAVAWKRIQLIVYDFDGVMTDNRVYVSETGVESVACNRSDGLAIGILREAGYQQIIVSTEANPVVLKRAEKLKLEAITDCRNKAESVLAFAKKNGISMSQIAFVGNDTNDLEAMKLCGLRICPRDAHRSIVKISQIVTRAKGGEGVIREIADLAAVKKKDLSPKRKKNAR